jgi:hypothetical protein
LHPKKPEVKSKKAKLTIRRPGGAMSDTEFRAARFHSPGFLLFLLLLAE